MYDHLHRAIYTDGVKLQNFDYKMSVLLVVAVVAPELVPSITHESLDDMWKQKDNDIKFVCMVLNQTRLENEARVSVEGVKCAVLDLELLFISQEPSLLASPEQPQCTGRKRKPSQVLSGQIAHR